jgi:16S rRNA (adenine1518-N6/adenine1519-N6)-dimethyltransferase
MNEVIMLTPADVRSLAARAEVIPTKKLGQNFVVDANTVRKIVVTAGVQSGDVVLEVGPGLGSLTLGLLEAGAHVDAVEIDRRLARELPSTVGARAPGAKLCVINEDAMQVTDLPHEPRRLVANLPYNVSVPILIHLLETFPSLQTGLVMVQSEVGERLAASPGSKIYGGPSVKAAWFGKWSVAGKVSRQVFWPVPNVDSVLVAFERHAEPGDLELREHTFELVDAAFGQRRKMLRQSLALPFGSSAVAEEALIAADIAPTDRGERLTVDDFIRLARTSLDSVWD